MGLETLMKLTAEQYDAYIRDGFLVFPELFDEAEVNILRNEADLSLIHI